MRALLASLAPPPSGGAVFPTQGLPPGAAPCLARCASAETARSASAFLSAGHLATQPLLAGSSRRRDAQQKLCFILPISLSQCSMLARCDMAI